MNIEAAIFDCDGTILDSMPMWSHVFPTWLTAHGIKDAKALAERYEYLNFVDECYFFHDHYSVCPSREQALAEVTAEVSRLYETVVKPFDGVRDFLEELHKAHIPMIIVSSTTSDLVRKALDRHGLLGFFDEVFYTGSIGYDKTHPDVYLAARDACGKSTDTTWVFEDAPFGAHTAHKAGFPTVCLFNDHDGRDQAFLQKNSDILAHSWKELSLARLDDYERPSDGQKLGVLEVLIVAGSPRRSSDALIAHLAKTADYIIAADRGAETLMSAHIAPDVFCGDADTVHSEAATWARRVAKRDIRFPKEKYATDLTIAFECAEHEATRRSKRLAVTLSCASGGRPDHFLGVIGQLTRHSQAGARIVEDADNITYEGRVLAAGDCWSFNKDAVGKSFSAIALAKDTSVSEIGLQWETKHVEMETFADVGISNIVESPKATVYCHTGMLACFLLG